MPYLSVQAQYMFIHDALDEVIRFGSTTIAFSQLASVVTGFERDKLELVRQFQVYRASTVLPLIYAHSTSTCCSLHMHRC